jgi:hypothetical protein
LKRKTSTLSKEPSTGTIPGVATLEAAIETCRKVTHSATAHPWILMIKTRELLDHICKHLSQQLMRFKFWVDTRKNDLFYWFNVCRVPSGDIPIKHLILPKETDKVYKIGQLSLLVC